MSTLSRRTLVVTAAGIPSVAIAFGVRAAQNRTATPSASPAASPMTSPMASPAAVAEVAIVDFGFEPAQIAVPTGTTVTWTNDGAVIHTTTDKARDKAWDSKVMGAGDTFSYTFTDPGTYEYWCALHPTMLGTVVVTGS